VVSILTNLDWNSINRIGLMAGDITNTLTGVNILTAG